MLDDAFDSVVWGLDEVLSVSITDALGLSVNDSADIKSLEI